MTKRKIKSGAPIRKTPPREDYDVVLIVCEGEKTEINYFDKLIESLKLNKSNIQISNIQQNTPDSVFQKAKELYRKGKRSGNSYNRVYCIFDKDKHPKYQETKNTIDQIRNPKDVYHYAFSEPCFEFWLLLHFIRTDKPFANFDELRKDKKFKKYFPNYDKSEIIFDSLKDKIPVACEHAKNNPHTNVNELVEYLQKIK